jgi:hypothetical protein
MCRFVDNNGVEHTYNAVQEAQGEDPYCMELVGRIDIEAMTAAVNQGIDSHLEACFVPDRGDVFEPKERKVGSRRVGQVLVCKVSQESMPVLLRRLFEGQEPDQRLAQDILDSLIELEEP